jgi:phosphatidylserine decarboxylase
MADAGQPVEVFNRYTGAVEPEPVFGERWLRWTYETATGRTALAVLVMRPLFSRWYGWRMDRPRSARLVAGFIDRFGIDTSEFAQPPGAFATFNDFFSRALKPAARPIDPDPRLVVFPADGRHLGFQDISAVDRIYAKGQRLAPGDLLADVDLGRIFAGGSLVVSRLCPVDYHRFHFPFGGRFGGVRAIAGPLFSVNPIALRRAVDYLFRNKRVVSVVESPALGRVAMVEIGATCVGTIVHTAAAGEVEKGAAKGWFRFGGSCVVTIFEPGRVRLADDLCEQTLNGRELYARVGDRMGAAG